MTTAMATGGTSGSGNFLDPNPDELQGGGEEYLCVGVKCLVECSRMFTHCEYAGAQAVPYVRVFERVNGKLKRLTPN